MNRHLELASKLPKVGELGKDVNETRIAVS